MMKTKTAKNGAVKKAIKKAETTAIGHWAAEDARREKAKKAAGQTGSTPADKVIAAAKIEARGGENKPADAPPASATAPGKETGKEAKAPRQKAAPADRPKRESFGAALRALFEEKSPGDVTLAEATELARRLAPKSGFATSELTAKRNFAWYRSKAKAKK